MFDIRLTKGEDNETYRKFKNKRKSVYRKIRKWTNSYDNPPKYNK